ncbi:MAG: response regulator [Planctomycetales bacterium]|nr:response regulator [Planctomycetales bacterium]
MNQKTVLVIDDSATIRKLVDRHLGSAGYRVVLAPNAEEGLQLAAEIHPDLILLDHQLPGTTGHNVATTLSHSETLRHIPVVISSTLRKKAYAEYVDLNNVVDMLPKPYTEELLQTTVANAIETASMIVDSQSRGSAVPEIIEAVNEAAFAGSLSCFGLRELIDFLNNGRKAGVLEVEAGRTRIRFFLEKGRIQGVDAQGISAEEVSKMIDQLPESLTNLAPVLKMTIAGKSCAEVDGFVQLLDQKVLDPRLMTRLLRFQAAMLVRLAFTQPLSLFRFETGQCNSLHKSLPLDISLLALLVEGAVTSAQHVELTPNATFSRRAIRGQNLDRAGLSAKHMQMFNVLSEPKETQEITAALGWQSSEVLQVLHGFELAELVERRTNTVAGQFVVYEPDASHAQRLRAGLEESDNRYAGKVVRDKLALQLVLKRSIPHTLAFAADDEAACTLLSKLFATKDPRAAKIKRVAITSNISNLQNLQEQMGFRIDETIARPCTAEQLFLAMDRLLNNEHDSTDDAFQEPQNELVAAGAES